ncbi:MAG TPA: hypothetical protein VKG67_00025 [Gallionellaceae bacterium]|nr:hypothetical protein [Gallionellaceae bacterium]
MNMQAGKIGQLETNLQISTVIAMTDALFGKPPPIRPAPICPIPISKPSPEEEIDICLALARNLGAKIRGLKNGIPGNGMPGNGMPDYLNDDLQSAENFAGGVVRKLQAAADGLADGAPEIPPACHCGECDGCVAARSDEHYDRKRDGRFY